MDIQSAFGFEAGSPSIPYRPEELLWAYERIRMRTGRAGEVGERSGDGGSGLQIESGVGPAQHRNRLWI